MNQPTTAPAPGRIIVLLYGTLATQKPFWLYAAIKPEAYDDFRAAQKNATVDFQQFEDFGEIIIAGEGQTPPAEVTLKIAEVYQTDPSKFFSAS